MTDYSNLDRLWLSVSRVNHTPIGLTVHIGRPGPVGLIEDEYVFLRRAKELFLDLMHREGKLEEYRAQRVANEASKHV